MDYIQTVLLVFLIVLQLLHLLRSRKRRFKRCTLMKRGNIIPDALRMSGIGIEELFSKARLGGYFNLGDIDTAVLEENGQISFLPKPMSRNLNPKDFNFAPVRDGVPSVIVKNGVTVEENLMKDGINRADVMKILLSRGRTLDDILLATITESGRIDVFERN